MLFLHVFSISTLLLYYAVRAQYNCSSDYSRLPVDNDLTVDCGPQYIKLTVNLCTAQYAGFDPNMLAMNGLHNVTLCQGTIDTSVSPPVIRYNFPVNDTIENICNNQVTVQSDGAGTGVFSFLSDTESVVIKGYIDTPKSSVGVVSYASDLYYMFTCRYPLEYLMNNTQVLVSSVALAVNTNNGTFISTLQMGLFSDTNFTTPLIVQQSGIPLQTKVYVQVSATNLTGSFNVLLDYCFATPSPFEETGVDRYNLFVGACNKNNRTNILQNGRSKMAQFSFDAFRFVQHRDRRISTIYVHCMTRLCEPQKCNMLLSGCSRRKRAVSAVEQTPGYSSTDQVTVSAGPIFTNDEVQEDQASSKPATQNEGSKEVQSAFVWLAVGSIFAVLLFLALILAVWFLLKKFFIPMTKPGLQGHNNPCYN
ncbi:zona pellucida-like domain-containing protein 1 isoform X2 [Polypterus senegalus]|uniref:zona pellucida-like domain-containing protein 1 isoform X2 n=1 Tax=Polypterus senegalus TaxID=55291 RepID=UPI001966267A|nr:zona pellucida-like domain-containing protein 1 isoform X2 [Polypterus senegalus]